MFPRVNKGFNICSSCIRFGEEAVFGVKIVGKMVRSETIVRHDTHQRFFYAVAFPSKEGWHKKRSFVLISVVSQVHRQSHVVCAADRRSSCRSGFPSGVTVRKIRGLDAMCSVLVACHLTVPLHRGFRSILMFSDACLTYVRLHPITRRRSPDMITQVLRRRPFGDDADDDDDGQDADDEDEDQASGDDSDT